MRVALFRCLLAVFLLFVAAPLCAGEGEGVSFEKEVLPVLKTHCFSCHGAEKQEANIRLDTLSTDLLSDRAAAETWHEVLNALNAGEMPPEDAKQLAARSREVLADWVSTAVNEAIEAQRATNGRVVLRRLNRREYQNTMRDLLDLEMDFTRDLPPDAISSSGFRNDGRSLRMSAIHLENYLATARKALGRVIVSGEPPQVFKHEFTTSNVGNWKGNAERHNELGRQQEFLAKIPKDYPDEGDFRVQVKFSADIKKNAGFPLLEVSVGYRPDTQILFREFDLVETSEAGDHVLEFRGRMEDFPLPVRGQGKFPGLVIRLRNRYDDGSPLPKRNAKSKKKDKDKDKKKERLYPAEPHLPTLTIQSVEYEAPVFESWPPARHRRILFDSPLREKDEPAYVREVLQRFMTRAFRRPVTADELKEMSEFFAAARDDFPVFEDAMRETLAMVLIRPAFLYLVEPAGDSKRKVTDWELASRLSYFLWSTMPDEQLRKLAAEGKLRDAKTLQNQVERMLKSPLAWRFVEQFTDQWLKLNVIDSVAVSKEAYPGFDEAMKEEMRAESQHYFAALLRDNKSALQLLTSDFTYLNEPLARHYGVDDVYGREFRRVKLKADQHRGGLLGHAGILLANSTGDDSHAVRRAVWIRDRLLNDPPAPPPADVPSLEEADEEFHRLSIREQLAIHGKREACASCHRDIDPWGIALENFGATGLWRTEIRRKTGRKSITVPVDSQSELPGGVKLTSVEDLKQHLVTRRRDDFARALVARLLTYALGRRLELGDQPALDKLTADWNSDGLGLRNLIQLTVLSDPFQTK